MQARNKLPLIYILNECAEKDEKTGRFSIKPTHLRWIISYSNFMASSKFGHDIFDIEILKELTEDKIDRTINSVLKINASKKEIYESVSKEDMWALNKARWEYIHNQKPWLNTKEGWAKICNSIKMWFTDNGNKGLSNDTNSH